MRDSDCVEFLQWALPQLDLRWPGFRKVRGQVCKRIRRRMQTLGLPDFAAYRVHIVREPAEWTILDSFCRITISRFYRDKAVFQAIDSIVLPDLAARGAEERRGLRCWAIGCASGEEVYTLRFLWDCAITGTRGDFGFFVLGTDVDDRVLHRASAGCYAAGSLKDLPEGLTERCFEARGGQYCVKPKHRHGVTFARQDIRREMPEGPFDLVLCRNVILTYFGPSLQISLMRQISERLVPGGYFAIGAHEALPADVVGFEPLAACSQILQWRGTANGKTDGGAQQGQLRGATQ